MRFPGRFGRRRPPRDVTVGGLLRDGRAWADGVRCSVAVDRETSRLIVPGPAGPALGSMRRAVTDAVAHGATRLRCSASANDGVLVVSIIDDGGPRPPVERVSPVPGGTATEVGYRHGASHVWVLEYVWTPVRSRRRVNVSMSWPRWSDSSAIPRPERRAGRTD